MSTRSADFAGSWYPAGESECLEVFREFEKNAVKRPGEEEGWIGGILPHAGWVYSGQIAYNVIRYLKNGISPDIFVIFGRHLYPGSGNFIMAEGSWATPLGELPIASDLAEKILSLFKFTVETHSRYEPDNTIELQLPIIKHLFPEVEILPVGVPPAPQSITIGERVSETAMNMGKTIFVLGSTDLTHYGPSYANTAMGSGRKAVDWVKNENDKRMVDLIVGMEPEKIIKESLVNSNACCSGAAAAAVAAMKKSGAIKGKKLVYSTSYDVRPDSSFVGYTGVVFSR